MCAYASPMRTCTHTTAVTLRGMNFFNSSMLDSLMICKFGSGETSATVRATPLPNGTEVLMRCDSPPLNQAPHMLAIAFNGEDFTEAGV